MDLLAFRILGTCHLNEHTFLAVRNSFTDAICLTVNHIRIIIWMSICSIIIWLLYKLVKLALNVTDYLLTYELRIFSRNRLYKYIILNVAHYLLTLYFTQQ